MKDWAYTFNPVSKKEWLDQIEKDLRGKSMESLYNEWWPGETLNPFIHQEDAIREKICLPANLFKSPPTLMEPLYTIGTNPLVTHQQIMEALQYGAETILIYTASLQDNPIEIWLEGVHMDMVQVIVQPEEYSGQQVQAIKDLSAKGVLTNLLRSAESAVNVSDLLSETSLSSIRLVYSFPSKGNWHQSASETLNRLLHDLESCCAAGFSAEKFFHQVVIQQQSDPSYFKHIIQARVLCLLWQNIKAIYGLNDPEAETGRLECHVLPETDENPDQYLIHASMSGLAGSLTGIEGLCVHPKKGSEVREFYRRSNRNIHHLLHLESNMYSGKDPLAGAYALDQYTLSWTKLIWERLHFG